MKSVSKTDVLDTLILLRVTAALTKKEAGNISRLRFLPCYTIIQRYLLRSGIFSFSIDILCKSANSLKSVMCIPVIPFSQLTIHPAGICRNNWYQTKYFAQYENGRNEPIDAVIKLICDTLNVSEKWLRAGEGELFIHVSRDDELLTLIEKSMTEESGEIKRRFATAVMKLNSEQIQACTDWIKSTFDLVEREKTTYSISFDPEQIIKEKVASYEAELRAELFSKASQGASQTESTDTGSHKAI